MRAVDLCLTDDLWVGSRAIWNLESVKEVFVTFAEADAIGMSSVTGLIQPVSRNSDYGLHLTFCPPGQGLLTIYAPIAPGLILPVGISKIQTLTAGAVFPLKTSRGVVALDGEREFVFSEKDKIRVWLDLHGPLTIDVPRVMQIAAKRGMLNTTSPFVFPDFLK